MRGTIRKSISKDNRVTYSYMVYIGKDENNKKKYKHKRGFTKRNECEIALAAYINENDKGIVVADDKMTVMDYMDYWLATYPKVNCQPSTYKRYNEFSNDIKHYLGRYKLGKLNPLLVQKFYADLKTEKELSNNTIIKTHRMFHLALKHAQKWQLLYVNPCDLVTLPPAESIEMKYWNPEDITMYLNELKEEFLYPIIFLAVHTGLREGELCALLWSDINLIDKTLNVSKTLQRIDGKLVSKIPKTKKSSRIVTLLDSTVKFLKEFKKNDNLIELNKDNYLFHWLDRRPMDPHYVAQHFPETLERHKTKVPTIRFHDLRHTHATLLRALKVDAKVISERLGHSDVAFTLRVYTHVNTDMQRDEVSKANDFL